MTVRCALPGRVNGCGQPGRTATGAGVLWRAGSLTTKQKLKDIA